MKEASKLKGKSGSVDGWLGDELCDLPQGVFERTAALYDAFERAGMIPQVWMLARQSHIPKANAVDGVHEAEKLRPITVLSPWYRLFGSARLKSLDAQQWLNKWWPEAACGGTGIMDALSYLAEAAMGDEGYLLSLDYSLAFDRLDPHLARHLLLQAGLPVGTCDVMCAVWENQTRFLQYDNQCLPYGIKVSTSLPQGDAWSLVAMVLCLVGPSLKIQGMFPTSMLKTFVDDRTIVARTAQETLLIKNEWASWSEKLGMEENQSKIRYFHASAQGRRNLANEGADPELICQDPCVLGVHLRGRQLRTNTPKEELRLSNSCKLIRRCAMLPVSWQWKKRVVSTQGLAKAVWGWVCRLPPKVDREKVNSAVRVALGEGQNASVALRAVLRGHSLDFGFRVLSASFSAAQKQAWKRRGAPCSWASRGWPQVLHSHV